LILNVSRCIYITTDIDKKEQKKHGHVNNLNNIASSVF